MSIEDSGEGGAVDLPTIEKRRDAEVILEAADLERGCHEMLRPQHPNPDVVDIGFDGPIETLGVEVAGHWKKLDRPSFDHHAFVLELCISGGTKVGEDRLERKQSRSCRREILDRDEYVDVARGHWFEVVECANGSGDGVTRDYTVAKHPVEHLKSLVH